MIFSLLQTKQRALKCTDRLRFFLCWYLLFGSVVLRKVLRTAIPSYESICLDKLKQGCTSFSFHLKKQTAMSRKFLMLET